MKLTKKLLASLEELRLLIGVEEVNLYSTGQQLASVALPKASRSCCALNEDGEVVLFGTSALSEAIKFAEGDVANRTRELAFLKKLATIGLTPPLEGEPEQFLAELPGSSICKNCKQLKRCHKEGSGERYAGGLYCPTSPPEQAVTSYWLNSFEHDMCVNCKQGFMEHGAIRGGPCPPYKG